MKAIIDIEARHPQSDPFPVSRIFVETKRHQLKLPAGQQIEVLSLSPQSAHSESERIFIKLNFYFFHRKIVPTSHSIDCAIGGYLLGLIPGKVANGFFTSYFPLAEATLLSGDIPFGFNIEK